MIKRFIYRILCNEVVGMLVRYIFKGHIPNLRYPQYKFDVTQANMDKKIIASIFWGFYESAEIRFVEKYFNGEVDAIEFGASSGIVSSHIVSKFQNGSRRLIGVEANKNLIATWHKNVERYNVSKVNITLLNYAIYYGGESIRFALSGNTTESRILSETTMNESNVEVKSISLANLLKNQTVGNYALFCDIEGAELQMFLNEDSALRNCKHIFIELHDTREKETTYTVNDLNLLIQKKGFELVDRHGPVCYYRNLYKPSNGKE
jgi:FkbM family methyltransferase